MSLEIRDIRHRYGDHAAVDGASLKVAAGEIVVLFGPSGCGKTTLLRVAAGLERPLSGAVLIDDVEMTSGFQFVPPEKRPVGFVFQDYVLFPHLTAAENVAFGLNALSVAERRLRAGAELAAAGLSGLDDRRPNQLSGGQQQRVALARAMARSPKAMLLDEPFAGVDAVIRRRLRDEVRKILKSNGAAAILVTHDPDEALALGDRIAIMKSGRIIEAAAPQVLFERAATVEGALLFPGAQTFRGERKGGNVATAFGDFAVDTVGDGPVVCVAYAGAIDFSPSPTSRLTVRDNRFAGPGWRIEAGIDDAAARLVGASLSRLSPGTPVQPRFNHALIRVFAQIDANANYLQNQR